MRTDPGLPGPAIRRSLPEPPSSRSGRRRIQHDWPVCRMAVQPIKTSPPLPANSSLLPLPAMSVSCPSGVLEPKASLTAWP